MIKQKSTIVNQPFPIFSRSRDGFPGNVTNQMQWIKASAKCINVIVQYNKNHNKYEISNRFLERLSLCGIATVAGNHSDHEILGIDSSWYP